MISLYSSKACKAAVRSDCFWSSWAFSFSVVAIKTGSAATEVEEVFRAVEQQEFSDMYTGIGNGKFTWPFLWWHQLSSYPLLVVLSRQPSGRSLLAQQQLWLKPLQLSPLIQANGADGSLVWGRSSLLHIESSLGDVQPKRAEKGLKKISAQQIKHLGCYSKKNGVYRASDLTILVFS